ncbi:MAG: TIGR04076 family protein [Bacillota bacterium]
MHDLRIVVEEIRGFCDLPMHPGDHFFLRGGRIYLPEGQYICMWALQSMMPLLPAKQRQSAESNDWIPHTSRICCPDPNGQVIWRIEVLDGAPEKLDEQGPPDRMLVDEACCAGCRRCEMVCSFGHQGAYAPWLARIQIEKHESEGIDRPRVCRQCGNARCVSACPTQALSKDVATGAVRLDADRCVGCGLCRKACPFGSVHWDEENRRPLICDLCGGQPRCIGACPTQAIRYGLAGSNLADTSTKTSHRG